MFRLTCFDYLRAKLAKKRDQHVANLTLQTFTQDDKKLLHIFMLLEELEIKHQRQASVFELNKIIGFSLDETAKLVNNSKATVSRDINFARHWLAAKLVD